MTSFTKTLLALGLAVTGLSSVYAGANTPIQVTQMSISNTSQYVLSIKNAGKFTQIKPYDEVILPLDKPAGGSAAVQMHFVGKSGPNATVCSVNTGQHWYPKGGGVLLLNIGLNARIKPAFSHVSATQFNFNANQYQDIYCSALQ